MLLHLFLSGCATSGKNHVYVTTQGETAIQDVTEPAATLLAGVVSWERVQGLAYDYNTDHLFVRLWPSQIIRVIERPSGKILREMLLPPSLHTLAPADLAVRSSDRHLFAVHLDGHSVVELTLYGETIRRIEFPSEPVAITGLAFDQTHHRLLLLRGNTVAIARTDGLIERMMTLQAPLTSVSLGYDSTFGHYFAPLADSHTLGEFDSTGVLLQRHEIAGQGAITGIDAGPRSLVRVF